MPVLIQRQHLHRNVPGGRILFQMIEDGPAQHVGQEHIQRNRRGMELARQGERFRAAQRDQHFESFIPRQIAKHTRIVRIVFHDQQHRVVWLQVVAVVGNLLDRAFRHDDIRQLKRHGRR